MINRSAEAQAGLEVGFGLALPQPATIPPNTLDAPAARTTPTPAPALTIDP